MRKIDKIYENIFDNYYIDLSEYLNHYLHKIHIKPNHLTLLSLITGIFSAYLVYTDHFFKALCLLQCSYLLDCMDGSMARTYKQETTFGDYFDHISDIIKLSILLFTILINTKIIQFEKILFFIICSILFILLVIHFGCQEKIYNKNLNKNSLYYCMFLCKKKKYINLTKYFGSGTFINFISLFLLYKTISTTW